MEVITSIATTIGGYLVPPFLRQFGYVLFYKSHVGDFKKQVEELKKKKFGVQGRATEAERNGDFILPDVTSWLQDVDKITQESSTFFDGEAQTSKRCFNVPYPDLKSRYKRGRKAKKNTKIANELQQSGGRFETIALHNHPYAARFRSTEAVEDFESRKETFKEVMKAIKDPKVNTIGIHGIGGVGKTTLVKQVAEQEEVKNQFNEIVMAVVSQTSNVEKIQQQIAEMLGVKFEGESVLARAERLRTRLNQIEKVLVILDDIWRRVDLGTIGIPFGAEHQGCKIVITSRNEDACNQMATQKNVIKVGILKKEEAWNLFRKMAGDRVDSPEIKPLASKVVKRCSGLPMAIVIMARALEGKSLYCWKEAANDSRMDEDVSSIIQLSYDYLEREGSKSLFLLCSIYGEDDNIEIEGLWKYGFSLGLFQGLDSVERARNRTYVLAEYLKYLCLLEEGRNNDYVKMHDVVRDFAISVASKHEHGFLVRSGPGLNESSDSSQCKRYTTISLISNAIPKLLDEKLEFPKLELLYLECTNPLQQILLQIPLLQIPDKLFSGMKKLKVLVMSKMYRLKALPSSVADLKNLQTLCLRYCALVNIDLSIIGELTGLKFLSFFGSNVKELPKEIGELIHLKLLDLSRCAQLKIIPRDVILRLSELEGLYMGDDSSCFEAWEIEDQNTKRSNVSVGDLKHLPILTSLKIVVRDEKCLPDTEDLFKNLVRFQMYIGRYSGEDDYELYSKALKLDSLRNIHLKLLSTLFKATEYLCLNNVNGLGSVLYDLEGEILLKCLTVKDCGELEYVFNTKDSVLPATVSSLEKLHLYKLPNLKGISHGQLSNLRVVKVDNCNGLKNLFSHFKATDLQQLSDLRVEDCEMMEEIFGVEIGASLTKSVVFPSLRVLCLDHLPKLINFCTDTHMKNHLFHEKVMFPVLEKLKISMVNVKDIWHHNFKNLSCISISECHSLKSLFRSSIANSLGQLQEVEIDSCRIMETIIWKESCMERNIVFPQLQRVTLKNLPNLASFHNSKEDLTQPLPLFGSRILQVAFPVVEKLSIVDLRNFKEIWHPQLPDKTFSRLKVLEVRCCEELLNVIPLYMLPRLIKSFSQLRVLKVEICHKLSSVVPFSLQSLEELSVKSCDSVEEVVAEVEGHQVNELFFLFLKKLTLETLAKLKQIMCWDKYPQGTLVFQSLISIHVFKCDSLKSLIPPRVASTLVQLQQLSIISCEQMEEVVIEVEGHEVNELVFPRLQKLTLGTLPKLKHIMCWDKYPAGFQSLVSVDIITCDSLKSLIPPWVASTLVQLQELSIRSCEQMETVIGEERQGEENCLNWPSLKTLEIARCPAMKRFTANIPRPQKPGTPCPFFHNKVALTSLKLFIIQHMENVEEIFDNQLSDESFFQLDLYVNSCDKLLRVIPSNVLKKLHILYVMNCNLVEEISEQGLEQGHAATISFTDLERLELKNLPNLKILFSGKHKIECPSLYQIILKDCPKIQTFSSGFTSAPMLKTIDLEGKKYMLKDDINTTVQQLFHEKELLGGEESSKKLDSGSAMEDHLQTTEGGISTERREGISNNSDNSTSMMEENPLTLEMGGSGDVEDQRSVHQNIDSTEDAGVVSGDEPSRKRRIISSEEKGKAKVLDGGSEKVSHTTSSSHQLPSSSGISITRSAMEDPQTPNVDGYIDVANTDIFPDDIARRPLGDQNVRHDTDSTENDAEADMSTQDTFLLEGANHARPDDMFTRYQAEVESLQRDRDLLRHRMETLEDLLNHSRTDEMVTGYRPEIESLQRDRELMRRVETLEDSLRHAHTNEMVVRSDRDMLRRRVETLEDSLVIGNYGGKLAGENLGLSTTLVLGLAVWSLCLIFGLLYFFAHYSQLLFVHLKH